MAWFALALAVLANSLKFAVRKAAAESTEHSVIGILVQWRWIGICAAIILLGSYLCRNSDSGLGVSYTNPQEV